MVDGPRPAGERRQGRVVTHGAHRLFLFGSQRLDQEFDVLFSVTCGALGRDKQSALTHREGRGGSVTASLAAFRAGDRCRTGFEPRQEDHVARDPLAILAPVRDLPLHLVVLENLLMGEVHEEDLARTESSLLHDAFGFDIEYPDL